jgi:hypothetical protein
MKKKPYWELTPAELGEATNQFDEPFVMGQVSSFESLRTGAVAADQAQKGAVPKWPGISTGVRKY